MSKPLVMQALFAICFGLLLLRLAVAARKGLVPRNRALIWAVLWSTGLVLVLSPSLSFHLARALGVTRGTDAVTYTAIAFLSVMVFRAFQLIDVQDRELSRLTTELAIYEWEHRRGFPSLLASKVGPDTPRDEDLPVRDEEAPA
jgi:hypothetical protein